jgi:hypothetical protein
MAMAVAANPNNALALQQQMAANSNNALALHMQQMAAVAAAANSNPLALQQQIAAQNNTAQAQVLALQRQQQQQQQQQQQPQPQQQQQQQSFFASAATGISPGAFYANNPLAATMNLGAVPALLGNVTDPTMRNLMLSHMLGLANINVNPQALQMNPSLVAQQQRSIPAAAAGLDQLPAQALRPGVESPAASQPAPETQKAGAKRASAKQARSQPSDPNRSVTSTRRSDRPGSRAVLSIG